MEVVPASQRTDEGWIGESDSCQTGDRLGVEAAWSIWAAVEPIPGMDLIGLSSGWEWGACLAHKTSVDYPAPGSLQSIYSHPLV